MTVQSTRRARYERNIANRDLRLVRRSHLRSLALDECPEGQVVGVDDAPERVHEDVRVLAIVEPPLQFLDVAVQVLPG